jgi:hypothetical protein
VDGKWGYIDVNGNMVIAPQFPESSYFSSGLAFTKVDGKGCFIDKTGKVIRCPDYKSIGEFRDGITFASEGEHHFMRSFYIDTEGNEYR